MRVLHGKKNCGFYRFSDNYFCSATVEVFCEFLLLGDSNNQENTECPIVCETKDNRELVDNNTAQNLSGEDIDELRRLETSPLFSYYCIFEEKYDFIFPRMYAQSHI